MKSHPNLKWYRRCGRLFFWDGQTSHGTLQRSLCTAFLLLTLVCLSGGCRGIKGSSGQPAAGQSTSGNQSGESTDARAAAGQDSRADASSAGSKEGDPAPGPDGNGQAKLALEVESQDGTRQSSAQTEGNKTEDDDPPVNPCGEWTRELQADARGDRDFPHGMSAGGARTDSVVIWSRTEEPEQVRVRYSAGPDCDEEKTGWQETDELAGNNIKFFLSGLREDALYRYRLEVKGGRGPSSSAWFHTAPTRDRAVTIAFSADITDKNDMYGLMDDVVDTGAELYLHLGDWPYADAATTADEIREEHLDTRDHPSVQLFMRGQAIHGIWDDHEVYNNWDGRLTAEQPERVQAAIDVWNEFFVIRDAPEGEIYRKHAWGPGLDIFYLDLRKHRSSNRARDNNNKTMMGAAQREWLLEELNSSEATFKLVLTSVPFSYGTTGSDHWIGFETEREALLDGIVEAGVSNVVFLTADQHFLAVHHMPRGFKMYQVGALAQTPRKPSNFVPPWVKKQHKALNFGVLKYQPGPPATLTFTAIGNQTESRDDTEDPGVLYTETLTAGEGRLVVEAPQSTLYDWQVDGAHTFTGRGGDGGLDLERAPPGEYTLTWIPLVPGLPLPEPVTARLRQGKKVMLSLGAPEDINKKVMLHETLDGPEGPWRILDQCQEDPDSDWRWEDGWVGEFGNCYDQDDDVPRKHRDNPKYIAVPKRGTAMIQDQLTFEEGQLGVRVYPGDNDGFGLLYNVNGDERYYRISLDIQRELVRLVANVDGDFTILGQASGFEAPKDRWYRLRVERSGTVHRVYLDDVLLLEADAAEELKAAALESLEGGGLGLYAWGMKEVRFDDLVVVTP